MNESTHLRAPHSHAFSFVMLEAPVRDERFQHDSCFLFFFPDLE
jgi:hypothetical protein